MPRSLSPLISVFFMLLTLAVGGMLLRETEPPPAVGEREALDIAVDAYTYGYPLVMMEMTRRIMTNVEAPETFRAPMGQFAHQRQLPSLNDSPLWKGAPNPDLLFSTAWIDLDNGPYILELPDFQKRFYLFNILDAWSSVVGSPGQRTLGGKPPRIAITGPNWKGNLPPDVKVYRCPTRYAWIIGQIQATPREVRLVNTLQDRIRLHTLAEEENPYLLPPPPPPVDPNLDMSTPVRDQVAALSPEQYFKLLAQLLILNPPCCEIALQQELEKIGFYVGEEFDLEELEANGEIDPAVARAFREAPTVALEQIRTFFGKTSLFENGWTTSTRTGVYLSNFYQRATIAYYGLGANRPEDTLFPQTRLDGNGQPLDGQYAYRMHFKKGKFPPVHGFWSISVYTEEGTFVPNPLNRTSLTSRDPMRLNPDGTFDLIISHHPPPNTSNWVPAPPGPFTVVFRMYLPKERAIEGAWNPPPIQRIE